MTIEIEKGFVVINLEEYDRLKEAAQLGKDLWEEHIKNILKGN